MELSKENMTKLDIYCKMTGKKAEDVVNEAVERELYYYVKSDKMPEKAILRDGDKESPCYIIEKTSMFGKPYYQVMVGEIITKVPESHVKLLEGEKAE